MNRSIAYLPNGSALVWPPLWCAMPHCPDPVIFAVTEGERFSALCVGHLEAHAATRGESFAVRELRQGTQWDCHITPIGMEMAPRGQRE